MHIILDIKYIQKKTKKEVTNPLCGQGLYLI